MNEEELEKLNRDCKCPNLQELFRLRRKAESLEARCNQYQAELNPNDNEITNSNYIASYEQELNKLKIATRFYYLELARKISASEIRIINKEIYETYNCVACNQQIDVAE